MSASSPAFNALLVITCLAAGLLLVRSGLLRKDLWTATLTPLSSIIGSGFLIMAPLLASIVGTGAPLAILGIVALAYSIGHVIRFNIMHVEPRIASGNMHRRVYEVEYLANIALIVAYVIAVAFYLSLLSNFFLNYLGISSPAMERLLTTAIILFITGVGYVKGLGGLERLESFSVVIQLAVILSLVLGLFAFGVVFINGNEIHIDRTERGISKQLQMLAGVLLIVQGFETSRFLGDKYSPEIRVSSMRNAQIISSILYATSVILLMPIVQHMDLVHINFSEIIGAMAAVAVVLPSMLVVAAIMSQFSAAVADMGGGGGLLRENSRQRLSTRMGYVAVAICSVLLVWAVDLLGIITLASRAFAAYYFLQTVLAIVCNVKDNPRMGRAAIVDQALFVALAVILAYVVIFSIPAG